jgi:hypothetical protein
LEAVQGCENGYFRNLEPSQSSHRGKNFQLVSWNLEQKLFHTKGVLSLIDARLIHQQILPPPIKTTYHQLIRVLKHPTLEQYGVVVEFQLSENSWGRLTI